MPSQTITVQGLELEVPASYHRLVVHVEHRCGHKPQGTLPATVKLRGDDAPHHGPCLPLVGVLRGCYVVETVHQLPTQCPACEMGELMSEGLDMRF
ncbi:hypothetical protein PG993_006229 [Apiospora rasikravindrae]|uniref:Uncharacterized protein n=1 Tax=Apiospora rasikravindrae TaxID=990691 RepID=A0ABR1T6R7_9PEZI